MASRIGRKPGASFKPSRPMPDRAGPFPRSQVDERRARPSSRDNLSDWLYPTPRVNLRGNHALSVANSASGMRGSALHRDDRFSGRWDQRDDLQGCAPCSSRHDRILDPAASKKAWDQRSALGRQVRSIVRPKSFRNFRRHKIHTKSRRNGLCISDFRFGFGNHR